MTSLLERIFHLKAENTTPGRELLAGSVSYFTIIYIAAVNSLILSEAGLPLEGAVLATILLSGLSCILMGFWANMPIILVPGMGVNALFAYTMVQTMGLSWQSALGAVFISGLIFAVIAFTRFAHVISEAIPQILKEAISIGIGLFLTLLGLEKGGIVTGGVSAPLAMGDLHNPLVVSTLITLLFGLILFLKKVPGSFLFTIAGGCVIAWAAGILDFSELSWRGFDAGSYSSVFASLSFKEAGTFSFWMAVFAMTMVLVFENIGLVHGHVNSLGKGEAYKKPLQAASLSVLASGIFGSSPTVATVETAAGIASGGRTGMTAVTTGVLFLLSIFVMPVIQIIPDSAVAPILIIIGLLMISSITNLDLADLPQSIPALVIIVMIPLTYSIADGMAFGFILYPILQAAAGRARKVSPALYLVALLFLGYFGFGMIH